MRAISALVGAACFASAARAHLVAWHPGMYCFGGTSGTDDPNANNAVHPLYQLDQDQWWMHHFDSCDEFPPPAGTFLELPAGGSFTVEVAANRGKTSYSFNGQYATAWGDGENHPDDYADPNCISSPLLHTQNQSMAAGTVFAISYTSDLSAVTQENLAVFTVKYNTPWKMVTTYDVPADMPACPDGGCICAWGWIPNGCGQPNMYMVPYRCTVTGATSTKAIGTAKAPVWCQDDESSCVTGPKQMLYWNQNAGDNIEVTGWDNVGAPKSPAYNMNCGFSDGAQTDIFTGSDVSSSSSSGGTSSTSSGNLSGSSSGSSGSSSSSSSSSPHSSTTLSSSNTHTSTSTSTFIATAASSSSTIGSSRTCKRHASRDPPSGSDLDLETPKKLKRSVHASKRNAAHNTF